MYAFARSLFGFETFEQKLMLYLHFRTFHHYGHNLSRRAK